jgi:exodeoxyribonuclease-3
MATPITVDLSLPAAPRYRLLERLLRHFNDVAENPRRRYRGAVRVATWNVNSIRQRLPRLLPWLDERRPDVVCLQETKLADEAFDQLLGEELARRGYLFARHGEVQWNGVAILSRAGLEDVTCGIAGAPGFPAPEARAVSASCGGIRIHCVYVPNGREPGSEHYRYKLAWLEALGRTVAEGPEATLVCGDVNIAPADIDVFDPQAYVGQTHVTSPERAALRALEELGLHDVVRERWPTERVFTYWDYRAGMFHKDLGMRIDLMLASAPVTARVRAAWVDRQARKGAKPSDHAPVIVDLDEARDGDIGPVVPPPSARPATPGAVKLPQGRSAGSSADPDPAAGGTDVS